MVILGHSMGGLLTKSMVQTTGNKLVDMMFKTSIDEMKISKEDKKMLKDALIFESLPFVKRVIFMSTPHRGSEMTHWTSMKLAVNFINLPVQFVKKLSNVNENVKMKKLKTLFLVVVSLLLLNSCALMDLQRDLNLLNEEGGIGGKLKHPYNNKASNIIVVFDKNRQIVAYKRLHPKDTYFIFLLPPNKVYRIFAYNDLDHNMYYDEIEPVGKWLNSKNVTVKAGRFYEIPDIVINSKNTIPPQYVKIIDSADKKKTNNMIVRSGVVADINNKIFDADHGEQSVWSPLELFKETGSGVYYQ